MILDNIVIVKATYSVLRLSIECPETPWAKLIRVVGVNSPGTWMQRGYCVQVRYQSPLQNMVVVLMTPKDDEREAVDRIRNGIGQTGGTRGASHSISSAQVEMMEREDGNSPAHQNRRRKTLKGGQLQWTARVIGGRILHVD